MTKAEYLEELRTGLEERFTPGETADILDEYAGFFDSGREEGRTEEDVAAGLGSPAALVRMLAAERAAPAGAGSVPFAAAAPVIPPRAGLAKRLGALCIDRLVVLLVIALLAGIAACLIPSEPPAVDNGPPSVLGEHLESGYEVLVETGTTQTVAIVWLPAFFLLAAVAPQLVIPAVLPLALASWIHPEVYKAEMSLFLILMMLGLLLSLLYKPVLECIWNGRTIGKRILRIRVAAPDGGKAGAGRILVRELLGDALLGTLSGGITTIVSIFTVAIGREHKSVPDYVGSTVVVPDCKL